MDRTTKLFWAIAALIIVIYAWGFFTFEVKPVQATAPAMPTQLDLGGVLWKVDLVAYPGDVSIFVAYTRCETHHIEIRPNASNMRETLVHEMLHAYTCQDSKTGYDVENFYYNSKTENGHEGFDRISFVINDALSRNPSLAAYLAGAPK